MTHIRPLSVGDAPALLSFYRRLSDATGAVFDPFPDDLQARITRHLEDADEMIDISFGLCDQEAIVGHGFAMRITDPNPVFGIGISEPYRGRGLGGRLARTVVQASDEAGARHLTLTVLIRNRKAVTMYERLGFVCKGYHTFREHHDSLLMVRSRRPHDVRPPDSATEDERGPAP